MGNPSLAEALADEESRKGPRCSIWKAINETLTTDQADELQHFVDDPTVAHTAIARGVRTAFGLTLNPGAIARHRKGDCLCRR